MAWIKNIEYTHADARLKRLYDRVKSPDGSIDNVLKIHSLRPHTLTGHMTLYKGVIHNSNNTLPKWYLESLGIYVSHLNGCQYCVDHHFAGLRRLLNDDTKSKMFYNDLINDRLQSYYSAQYAAGAQYAHKLTLQLDQIEQRDVESLRDVGFSDGEILEINQLVSYFNYVNRTVLGLGVDTQGDILGLSPGDSDDPKNWSHQ